MSRGDGSVYQRGPTWWVRYSLGGKPVRESVAAAIGRRPDLVTERDATDYLRQRIAEIRGGRWFGPQAQRVTVGRALDEWVEHLETRGAKSVKQIQSGIKPLRALLGIVRCCDLSAHRLERYVRERRGVMVGGARAYTDGTIHLELGQLRAALTLAFRRDRIARVPPFPVVPASPPRQGFLEPEQFARVVARVTGDDVYADALRFLYASGWRRSEVLGLTWAAVDERAGEVRLADSKNGHPRTLPLDQDVSAVLSRRRAARVVADRIVPWVFHRAGAKLCPSVLLKHFKAAARAAGFPMLLIHDLRRSAVRNMVRAGVPESVAMRVSGHRTRSVFDRYDVTSTSDVRAAVEQTARYRAAREGTHHGA